jgi:hypothetical protein
VSLPALALVALAQAASGPAPRHFESETIEVPTPIEGVTTLDYDGDKKLELLIARDSGLEIVGLHGDPNHHPPPISRLTRGSARTLAWCVAPAPGPDDSPPHDAVYLARDDGAILRWDPGKDPVELARTTALLLPSGVLAFPFARDLDGDKRTDIALPEPAGLRLWFSNPDGTLRKGPQVRHRVEAELDLASPEDARPEVAVSLTIPSFRVKDQNGDGFPDLAFESEDRLQFFWSGPGGTLPEVPTFELDLDDIKQKLQAGPSSILDPSNLLKAVSTLVKADVRDLDGDSFADLLLQQGSKVSIFAGTRDGIDRSKAAQVLKTSGNLIAAFSADDNRDGKLDLCMLQAQDISIGEVLLWVVAGGKLKIDLFTYYQEERLHFAKHPSRRRRMVIDFPAILSLASELKDNDTFKKMGEDLARVPVELDLDGDGKATDLAQLRRDGTIELHPGAAPPGLDDMTEAWRAVTDHFDRESKGKDEVEIELLEVVDWLPFVGGKRRAALVGRTPSQILGTPDPAAIAKPEPPADESKRKDEKKDEPPATKRVLVVLDVDGDGRDDLLLVDAGPETARVQIEIFRTK